jgi:ketosteroid isomerase-like protein
MTRRIALGLLALALSLPGPAFAQAGAGNLRALLEKVGQASQNADHAGTAAGVAALYTKDAKLMVPGSEPGSDAKTIQKLVAADIALGGKLALTTDDVVGFGDYALETGHWVATAADGKHLDHGPYLTFYKKADGGWKIYRDIWNSSMPAK